MKRHTYDQFIIDGFVISKGKKVKKEMKIDLFV